MMGIDAQKMKWLVQGHLGPLAESVIKRFPVLQISKLYVEHKTLKLLLPFLCLSINKHGTIGIL